MCSVPSVVSDSVIPWTVAHQALLSMGFPRQEQWSGLLFPTPEDLPDSGIEPESPAFPSDSLASEPPRKPLNQKAFTIHSTSCRLSWSKLSQLSLQKGIYLFRKSNGFLKSYKHIYLQRRTWQNRWHDNFTRTNNAQVCVSSNHWVNSLWEGGKAEWQDQWTRALQNWMSSEQARDSSVQLLPPCCQWVPGKSFCSAPYFWLRPCFFPRPTWGMIVNLAPCRPMHQQASSCDYWPHETWPVQMRV